MEEELFINELEDDENEQSELTFDSFKNTSTLSLDLNIDTIGLYYNRGKFVFDPDFQRRLVWDDKRKSQFIESLLLNIPIPSILLADDKNRNQYIIIDGKQRLSTIIEFLSPENEGEGLVLKGLEILRELNGYNYKKLSSDDRFVSFLSTFQTYVIKTTIIRNYSSKLLYFVFARLNSGSVPLSTQELRHSLFPGEFSNFVNVESTENDNLKRILKLKNGKNDPRMKDAELLCRYYAFKYFKDQYKNTVGELLDYTYENINKNWENYKYKVEDDMKSFNDSINFIYKIFGKDEFKLYSTDNKEFGTFNRLVFDVLVVWFSNKDNIKKVEESTFDFKEVFIKMFNDQIFNDAFKPVTSSGIKTNNRFERFSKMFIEKYGD